MKDNAWDAPRSNARMRSLRQLRENDPDLKDIDEDTLLRTGTAIDEQEKRAREAYKSLSASAVRYHVPPHLMYELGFGEDMGPDVLSLGSPNESWKDVDLLYATAPYETVEIIMDNHATDNGWRIGMDRSAPSGKGRYRVASIMYSRPTSIPEVSALIGIVTPLTAKDAKDFEGATIVGDIVIALDVDSFDKTVDLNRGSDVRYHYHAYIFSKMEDGKEELGLRYGDLVLPSVSRYLFNQVHIALCTAMNLFVLINHRDVEVESFSPTAGLNRQQRREYERKHGKTENYSIRIPKRRTVARLIEQVGAHTHARLRKRHWVRGFPRHYRSGKVGWIAAHERCKENSPWQATPKDYDAWPLDETKGGDDNERPQTNMEA